ncbi:unnamed protein product [Pleuronectes platessa]|uniref:Uncharacterized protein n=1 Tax=Pleuronectes platessa TaxID=8262 RepID=A0A9N7VCC9_PLEPL|nr:unnamed protein product [Pleuronectes platessa]
MMILRSDTTSFGLPVACIPRLPAGKIPPRDPKIYTRRARPGPSQPVSLHAVKRGGERGERKGQGQSCKPGQATSSNSIITGRTFTESATGPYRLIDDEQD